MVLSDFTSLNATTATRRTQIRDTATGSWLPQSAEDQVAVSGVLESGAVASVHYRGGTSRGTNLLWEINGTKGISASPEIRAISSSVKRRCMEPKAVSCRYPSATSG